MRSLKNRKGFTLLEILIVIVILGVIAGLAIPVFTAQIDRARGAEAVQKLGAVKNAFQTYWATRTPNAYTGGSITVGTAGFIGFDPNTVAPGQVNSFTYALTGVPAAATFQVTATCPAVTCTAAGGPHTVVIDQTGDITGTGAFASL